MHECYVIAARPYLEKVVDDKFFLIKEEATKKCIKLNRRCGNYPFKVYAVVVSFRGRDYTQNSKGQIMWMRGGKRVEEDAL